MTGSEIDKAKLEHELDQGALRELPPNIPPGLLGEVAPDLRQVDTFEPSLNAGVIQESTWETKWLVIVLLYLFVITSPVAAWLLWRDAKRSLWAKVLATVLGLAGYAALWAYTPH